MTLIVDLGGRLEDHLFPRSAKLLAESGDTLVLIATHQLASMMIFILLFTVRSVDRALGSGTLRKIFLGAPRPENKSASLSSSDF